MMADYCWTLRRNTTKELDGKSEKKRMPLHRMFKSKRMRYSRKILILTVIPNFKKVCKISVNMMDSAHRYISSISIKFQPKVTQFFHTKSNLQKFSHFWRLWKNGIGLNRPQIRIQHQNPKG